jgi:enamine deaminase RidA (YjgF/YER057c/UK114 family)
MPDVRRLFVSGTASISPDGKTEHVRDVDAQAVRTTEVVEAILDSRDMAWEDVTRATAYVRFPQDADVVRTFRDAAGRADLPLVVAHNVICRDDLLVELEVDAVQAR